MNKFIKVILTIVFAFLFGFMTVGYASLTQNMSVKGYMGLSELKAIYIVSVEQVDASEGSSVSNISYTNTLLTSNITLNISDANAYVTLEITIKNNTDNMEAGFNDFITSSTKIDYTSEPYSNTNKLGIHYMDTKLSPGEFRTFRVTIKYENNTVSSVSKMKDVLNIDFIPWSISGANAVFENLLNNPENFAGLDKALDEGGSALNHTYVSNADGANSKDIAYIEENFAGNMTTFIPDPNTGELKQTEMTIFIKRANIDNNSNTGEDGDEYILFMTADKLEDSGGTAVVYAYVYTKFSQDNDFVMVGEMFEGTCRITSYSGLGAIFGTGTGSFNTGYWKSSKEYYGLAAGANYSQSDSRCGNLGYVVEAAIAAEAY